MAVSDRLEQALIHYDNDNFDSCLLELSAAIDVTAKRKWPELDKPGKVSQRFQDFFREYRHFVFFGAFGWLMMPIDDLELSTSEATLAQILYKRMRTPSVHDGSVEAVLEIIDTGLKVAEPKFGIGRDFILALIICVIGDPANKTEKFKHPVRNRIIGSVELPLADAWGQFKTLSSWLYAQAKISPPKGFS
jgi:hypothetical protein